ncbi:hypothetical protein M0R04_13750 [Candidatus Dojkabacteria bacterium]|nr:hypothetical protein [Candidatus Dojkabacteria bacterium]
MPPLEDNNLRSAWQKPYKKYMKETNPAVLLGKKSWEKISKGKTKEELFAFMSAKKKGKKKVIPTLTK